jgi:hypothetical protein
MRQRRGLSAHLWAGTPVGPLTFQLPNCHDRTVPRLRRYLWRCSRCCMLRCMSRVMAWGLSSSRQHWQGGSQGHRCSLCVQQQRQRRQQQQQHQRAGVIVCSSFDVILLAMQACTDTLRTNCSGFPGAGSAEKQPVKWKDTLCTFFALFAGLNAWVRTDCALPGCCSTLATERTDVHLVMERCYRRAMKHDSMHQVSIHETHSSVPSRLTFFQAHQHVLC